MSPFHKIFISILIFLFAFPSAVALADSTETKNERVAQLNFNNVTAVVNPGGGSGPGAPRTFAVLFGRIGAALLTLIGALATLVFIIAGIWYILALGDEQKTARAKRIILFAILGIIVSGLAAILAFEINRIIFPTGSTSTPFVGVRRVLVNIMQAVLVLLAVIAFAALAWGGALYILSVGDEDRSKKARRTIFFAIVGIIIVGISAMLANAIINIF